MEKISNGRKTTYKGQIDMTLTFQSMQTELLKLSSLFLFYFPCKKEMECISNFGHFSSIHSSVLNGERTLEILSSPYYTV